MRVKSLATLTLKQGAPAILPGAEAEIDDTLAKDLLARGLVEMLAQLEKPAKPAGEALIEAIAAAALKLDKKEDFGKDGKPNVKALSLVLGYSVTAEERDAAFDRMNGKPSLLNPK